MNLKTLWRTLVAGAALALVFSLDVGSAQAAGGDQKFNSVCAGCHSIGGGKRVGPDLKGVTDRRSEAWLLKFIKSSQTMINSGDPDAVKVFNEYNKTPMPDMAQFSDADIKEILEYIKGGGGGGAAPVMAPATPAEIKLGGELFQGIVRLKNGGAACNSCHHVTNDAVIGGGVLAKDLTEVFTRVGGTGVGAILGKPPFPVMEAAYKDAPITPEESRALVGFLQDVDKKRAMQTPKDYGNQLVLGGTGMFIVLMGLYSFAWRRRKPGPVNQAIFDRQVKSQ